MRLHTIGLGSRSYRGRKCPECKLVVKPGETIVEISFHITYHRKCLARWLGRSYEAQPKDGLNGIAEQRKKKKAADAAEFDQYRQKLLDQLGADAT